MNFVDTLNQLDAGNLVDDANDRLAELVKAVATTGKPGSMTITVNVRKATADAMALTGKCAMKKPVEPPAESLMFHDENGQLSTQHPKQISMELKEVTTSKEPAPLKVIGSN